MESIGGVGGVCVEFMSGMGKQEVGEGKVCVEVMSWMGRQQVGEGGNDQLVIDTFLSTTCQYDYFQGNFLAHTGLDTGILIKHEIFNLQFCMNNNFL